MLRLLNQHTEDRNHYLEAAKTITKDLGFETLMLDRVIQWESYPEAAKDFDQAAEQYFGFKMSATYFKDETDNKFTILLAPRETDMDREYGNYIELHSVAHELAHALIFTRRQENDLYGNHVGFNCKGSLTWKANEGAAEILAAQLMPLLMKELGWGRNQLGEIYYLVISRDTAPAYNPYRMAMNILLGLVGNHWDNNQLYNPRSFPINILEMSVLGIVDLMASENPLDAITGAISYMHDIARADARHMVHNMLNQCDKLFDEYRTDREVWNKLTDKVRKAGVEIWDDEEYWEDLMASILADQNLAA